MEFYIFLADEWGMKVIQALQRKAREGLDVRLMVDAIGSAYLTREAASALVESGVQVHYFHTLSDAFWRRAFFRILNRRNHRKLVVIDDEVCYFGGMNIVDTRSLSTDASVKSRRLPIGAGWRDLHVRMAGPSAKELAEMMDRFWRWARREPGVRWPRWPVASMLQSPLERIYFFDSIPSRWSRRPRRVLAPLLEQSRERIVMAFAYFIPMPFVMRQLRRARKRGVQVDIIVPHVSDVPLVQGVTRSYYRQLLKWGIRVHERHETMLHTKAMVVDHRWVVIGSCNLDPRSLLSNFEFVGVFVSEPFAHLVSAALQYEMDHSQLVAAGEHKLGLMSRLVHWIAWRLQRWL